MAMLMAAELSHDQLEDLFQNAMDDDGYFDEPKLLARTCPRCGEHNLDPPLCVGCAAKRGLVG